MTGRMAILLALAAMAAPGAGHAQDAAGAGAPVWAVQTLGDLRTTERLPGWDEASASAGCLAVASNLPPYLPDASTPQQVQAEGEYWSWRLQALAPDEPVQIEYWEAAHGWLEAELKSMDADEARDLLAGLRGQCVIARAFAQSETMWSAMR